MGGRKEMRDAKRKGIDNFDYLALSILIFGFVIAVIGFWQFQTVLWNRFKYSTGSQWVDITGDPIYGTASLSEIGNLLNGYISLFMVGGISFIAAFIFMAYQYIIKRKWFPTSKLYFVISALISFIFIIISGWTYTSLRTIDDFPSWNGGITGYEWIHIQIPNHTRWLTRLSLTFGIGSLLLLTVTIVMIFVNWSKIKELQIRTGGKAPIKETLVQNTKNLVKDLPMYIVLIAYLVVIMYPVYLAIRASISEPYEIFSGSWPSTPLKTMVINYSSVLFKVSPTRATFIIALKNSLFLGVGVSTIGILISVSTAYGLARFNFRAKKFMTFLILSTQMFPAIILIIPQFVLMSRLGFLSTNTVLWGVLIIMTTGATAYVTWMMKGYFETIPVDMEEAALIDGYGRFGSFIKIALPLARPGMIAVMVFTFLGAWQEFILAQTFITQTAVSNYTLPLLFQNFQRIDAPDIPVFYELLSAYSIIVALPVVIFYLLLQKQLMGGAIAGGIK
jgi:ABC-type glycerol-3-phosphate transport system permease component